MDSKHHEIPEFQFLLDCCKSFSADKASCLFKFVNINESLDEEILFTLIQRHRVLPLATAFILNSNFFSESFKRRINIEFSSNQLLALKSKRLEILFEEFLGASKIFGFLFKGVSLANDFYGDIAMRQVYDVDLYVEQNSFEKAHEWLLNLGYKDSIGFNGFTNTQKRYFKYAGHDLSYYSDNKNLPELVELHWCLREGLGGYSYEPKVKMDQIDELLYLCVHGTEHAWFRLKWICDILQIVKSREFDWAKTVARAIDLNCMIHLKITWLVLNKYFQIEIPQLIAVQLQEKKYSWQMRFISSAMAKPVPYRSTRIGKLSHILFLSSLTLPKFNFIIISKYLTSHNDWRLIKLPDSLFFVYILLRPFLWFLRGLVSIFSK